MICPNCKNPIQERDTRCEWCGAEFVSESNNTIDTNINEDTIISNSINSNYKKTDSKVTKNKLYILLGIAVLLIVILSIYIIDENDNHEYNSTEEIDVSESMDSTPEAIEEEVEEPSEPENQEVAPEVPEQEEFKL